MTIFNPEYPFVLPDAVPVAADATQIEALLARCMDGDDRAYALIYRQYATEIYRLCYSLLHHREDAEEVLQDAFEYAFRRLVTFDPQKSAFRTWLYRIAISRCRNKRRRKWLPTFSFGQLGEADLTDRTIILPDEQAQMSEEQQLVWQGLQSLSPKLREVAVLRYYNGLTYREIGDILGIKAKTAESRMRLGHKALKSYLVDKLDG